MPLAESRNKIHIIVQVEICCHRHVVCTPKKSGTVEYEGGKAMQTYNTSTGFRAVAIAAVVFGILGGAFCWWAPLGMIFSATGLVMGFAGWLSARQSAARDRTVIAGMILSLAMLGLNFFIAGIGAEIVKFGPLR
jgi:hypothetical protein